jgi:GNAT superfamily N-acetyltransferase
MKEIVQDLTRGITLRRASIEDATTIVAHRRAMFRDQGHRDTAALDSMAEKFQPSLQSKMNSGEYLAWLATTADQRVVAGAGLWLMDWPAHMVGFSPRRGNILNIFTEPEFRRRGLARRLMETVLAWCRANRIDHVVLHASNDGRPLYESMGFQPSNEMRIKLPPA